MAIDAETFAKKDDFISRAYMSDHSDDVAVNQIIGEINNLLGVHKTEMISTIVSIDGFASQFIQKIESSPAWRALTAQAEIYIKSQIESSIANTLAEMALGEQNAGASKYAKYKRGKKLAKYAKLIKKVPLFAAISFMTDIFDVHSNYKKALEEARLNKQAVKQHRRLIDSANQRTRINVTISNFMTDLKSLVLFPDSKYYSSRREVIYTIAMGLIDFLKSNHINTGHNVYDTFTLKLINNLLTTYKIKVTLKTYAHYSDQSPMTTFRSCFFHDSSLRALYIFLSTKAYTCHDLLFMPSIVYNVKMPPIIYEIDFPYEKRDQKPYFSGSNVNDKSVELIPGDNFANDATDYTVFNQYSEFYHHMMKRGWQGINGKNPSRKNPIAFYQGPRFYSDTFLEMNLNDSKFTPK